MLDPAAAATGGSPGEFRLWATSDATVMTLEGATAPLPEGTIAPAEIRSKVAAAAVKDGSASGAVRVALLPAVGWTDEGYTGEPVLSAEVEGRGIPLYSVGVLSEGESPVLRTYFMSAASGEVLHSREDAVSTLQLMTADTQFGPAGEFSVAP
jgi:hypothetical protein